MTIAVAPRRGDRSTMTDRKAFLHALTARGVEYAVLRDWGTTREAAPAHPDGTSESSLELLVHRDALVEIDEIAGRHGLAGSSADGERKYRHDAHGWTVRARWELRYGAKASWLSTDEPEARVLRRAELVHGVRVAAIADRLVDTVLHCLLDLAAFPSAYRRSLSEMLATLRADPPAAGRAAERVQQELAPALTWSDLLADILHERWNELLSRRARLRLHLWRRAPLLSTGRYLTGRVGLRTSAGPSRPSDTSDTSDTSGPDGRDGLDRSDDPDRSDGDRDGDDAHRTPGRAQIRGSSLLLGGRGLSVGLKFLAELLIVRYLTTGDYGAWTYALSAVVFLRGFAALGLNRAVSRFLPVHLERGETDRFFGVMAFVFGSLLLASAVVVSSFYAFPDFVAGLAGASPDQPIALLFIVIFLVPIDTIDDFLTALCAAFTDSRTIFVRRYLLSPGLRIGVALVLILLQADVRVLAYGYLIAGILGIGYYAVSVFSLMRRHGVIDSSIGRNLELPVRSVLSYTVPVMAADWCAILLSTSGPLLLGYFSEMSAVAVFQVVVPLVALTKVVQQSFGVLFEPEASRLHARNEKSELERFYWRAAVWVAVLTFPAFAVAFTAAEPLTVFLYGERYADAAPILSILAFGMFFDSVLGFNAPTIRVAGKVWWLVGANVTAAAVCVALNVLLIPPLGALGAAIGTGLAWLLFGALKQAALRLATGVRAFDRTYAAPYAAIALTTLGLVAARVLSPDSPFIVVPAAVAAGLVVLTTARRSLSITSTFPELGRVPLLKALLG